MENFDIFNLDNEDFLKPEVTSNGDANLYKPYPDYQENKEDWDSLNALYKYMLPENGIYVNSVAVLPEYQGKGLGQKLIQKAIESAKEKGFRAMYCHANEGESAHLFEKMGGQVISQRPNWFSTSHNYKVIRINLED